MFNFGQVCVCRFFFLLFFTIFLDLSSKNNCEQVYGPNSEFLVGFLFFFLFWNLNLLFCSETPTIYATFFLPVFGVSLFLEHQFNTTLNSNKKASPVPHYTLHCYNAMQIPRNQVFSSLSSIAHWGVQNSVGASTG